LQLPGFIVKRFKHNVQYILLCCLVQEKKFCADPAKILTGQPWTYPPITLLFDLPLGKLTLQ